MSLSSCPSGGGANCPSLPLIVSLATLQVTARGGEGELAAFVSRGSPHKDDLLFEGRARGNRSF
eukprot:1784568-Pyramimonas_sp.AAC.1